MEVYRYIELNPVRAGMADNPADYTWSSYQCNAVGKNSELLTPHEVYLRLGHSESERQQSYLALFKHHLDGKLLENIRKATNKGL